MNHTIFEQIPVGVESGARWAHSLSPTRALVFVHGFHGHAQTSWGETPDVIADDPRFESTDLFFFGYSSARRQIPFFAYDLRELLNGIADWSESLLGRTRVWSKRAHFSKYEEIIIVAHSLGAIIARRALLDGLKLNESWAARTYMSLFAPAHMGAFSISSLLDLTLAPSSGKLKAVLRLIYPVLNQIEPNSDALRVLADETKAFAPTQAAVTARHVSIAEIEQVVDTTTFCSDPPGVPIRGSDHITIIKSQHRDHIQADRIWKSFQSPLQTSTGQSTPKTT